MGIIGWCNDGLQKAFFGESLLALRKLRLVLDTLQRGVQWMGGAVDWGSII